MSYHIGYHIAPSRLATPNRGEGKFKTAEYLCYFSNTYNRMSREALASMKANQLSDRDMAIIQSINELKLLTTTQIQRLHFPISQHNTWLTAHRTCCRNLDRLCANDVLRRSNRHIGGLKGGSSSYVYGLGPVGSRLMNRNPKVYFGEPISQMFLEHTVAISGLVVNLIEEFRSGKIELQTVQTEPKCWRLFMSGYGAKDTLKPDLHLRLTNLSSQMEYSWFIEMDMGTTSLPSIAKKAQIYVKYFHSGNERDFFPRVLWIAPNDSRKKHLETALKASNKAVPGLHLVTTNDQAISVISGISVVK